MNDVRIGKAGKTPRDGSWRVLVDRLWPRGVAREFADWDEWIREAAPSTELRRWYAHDPKRHTEFAWRYATELRDSAHRGAIERLEQLAQSGPITLLTSTRIVELSHVTVLRDFLLQTRNEAAQCPLL